MTSAKKETAAVNEFLKTLLEEYIKKTGGNCNNNKKGKQLKKEEQKEEKRKTQAWYLNKLVKIFMVKLSPTVKLYLD